MEVLYTHNLLILLKLLIPTQQFGVYTRYCSKCRFCIKILQRDVIRLQS